MNLIRHPNFRKGPVVLWIDRRAFSFALFPKRGGKQLFCRALAGAGGVGLAFRRQRALMGACQRLRMVAHSVRCRCAAFNYLPSWGTKRILKPVFLDFKSLDALSACSLQIFTVCVRNLQWIRRVLNPCAMALVFSYSPYPELSCLGLLRQINRPTIQPPTPNARRQRTIPMPLQRYARAIIIPQGLYRATIDKSAQTTSPNGFLTFTSRI